MDIDYKRSLNLNLNSRFSNDPIDAITCVMPTSNDGSRLEIVTVYRSTATYKKPREGQRADREFSAYLEKIGNKFKSIVIYGDLNIHDMD